MLGPTFQHPDSRHVCDVCMGPMKKMMEVFMEARKAFLEACEVAGKGKLSGAEMAQGLIGDWEDKGDPLL